MKKTLFILVGLLLYSCDKKNDCIVISEKRVVTERYYFFFENENAFQQANQDSDSPNIPDLYSSGEVTQEEYDSYAVGDEYCY